MIVRRAVRWLHLSDLLCPRGADEEWDRAAKAALDRLTELHKTFGRIDFVLVSGDVARTGHPDEYARATELLADVRKRLAYKRREPFVLAVPGAHDMQGRGDGFRVADADGDRAFAGWREWWSQLRSGLPEHVVVREGEVPGDFTAAVTLADSDARIGIVGLNTATGRDDSDERAPTRLTDRIRAVCGDPARWRKRHHATLLLTHDAPLALTSVPALWREVASLGFTATHSVGWQRYPDDHRLVSMIDQTAVLRALSFTGYDEQVIRGLDMIHPQGEAIAEIDLDLPWLPVLKVWEHTSESVDTEWREPRFSRGIGWEPPTEDSAIDEPVAEASPQEELVDADTPPTREEVETLLWTVFPEDIDFKSFTFSELRDAHRRLPQSINRKARTQMLLESTPTSEIADALRRYLPEITVERLKELRASSRR